MKLRSIYPVMLVPLLCLILVVTLLLVHAFPFPFTHAASDSGRVPLPTSIAAFTKQSRMVTQAASSQPVTLSIGLSLRNQAGLDAYLQQVSTPGSPLYHHYLSPATFAALYGPSPASEAAVSNFVRSQGLTVTGTYANHLMIDVTGTVAQAEQAFQVQINNYQASNGRRFFANGGAASVPNTVAPFVASVAGLDNVVQYARAPLTPGVASAQLAANAAGIACPRPGAATVPTAYTPTQIATAYNFNALYNAGDLGEGQTVGLLELDGYSPSDLAVYASCFGGKYTAVKTIPIDGFAGKPGPNASEVELDMEMVMGLAPRLASLRVYEAANSLAAYNDAWARIVSDDVPVVSTSWVFCEQGPGMASEIQQENIFFQAAAAQGQTILAASGDFGASGCYDPRTGANTFPAVDDPASQPYVTGVGGTTLHIKSDNSYQSEQVWNDSSIKNGASGGGVSQVWQMPIWQQGPGVANAYTTGFREVPDVSINADPQTGYDVYCSVGNCSVNGGWLVIGGTSAAAPVWAAMVALANEAAVKSNSFQEGFLNPSLYDINHGASGTSYSSAFHDVVPVVGGVNNNDYVGTGNTYPDAAMYDLATGLGSFDAYNLVQNLITLGKSALVQTTPTSTTWYFAEGRVGANFDEYLTLENPGSQAAQVRVQYLLEGGTGPAIMHTVPPLSRVTVSVNGDLHIAYTGPGQSLSMVVTSTNGVGIVAERPMYFSWHGINSGTDALGATKLGQDFYFADVEAARNYTSYITILNPPGGQAANVTVTYYSAGVQLGTTTLVVPAGQRGTTTPLVLHLTRNAAVSVHSDQPVMVERPMYFSTARSNINGPVTGAATVVGATAPNADWLFAEGYTGANFHTYFVLANFDPLKVATATVKLEYSNGAVDPVTVPVPPRSQFVFDVNMASARFAQSTPEFSAEVTSDAPIVAQRQEYFRFDGKIPGGTDVIGMSGPAKTTYGFAEGYTSGGFSEFLTLQNPNMTSEQVAITLYLSNSITTQKIVTVGPQTRVTVSVNNEVVPIAQGNVQAGYAVAMSVQALTGTIVAERPMYFNYHNVSPGGTDVVGFTG